MPGLFSMVTAENFFSLLQRKWVAFYNNPTEEGLIDILLPLYHLREWIYPYSAKNYALKYESELTPEERIYHDLDLMREYKIIRSLCNHSKHFSLKSVKSPQHETAEVMGAQAGIVKCGDRLGANHFLVDGEDVRDIFIVVYREYCNFFNRKE